MKPIEEYTREEFIEENYGKRCPSDLGINEGDIPEFADEICRRSWELSTKDIAFKKGNKEKEGLKLVEVDVAEVIDDWLDEMKNTEGHCLFCKLEQEKTGYTFIDFLKENNIKMYKEEAW